MVYGANACSNAHSVLMLLMFSENKGEYCEKRIKKQNVQSEYVKEKTRKKRAGRKHRKEIATSMISNTVEKRVVRRKISQNEEK